MPVPVPMPIGSTGPIALRDADVGFPLGMWSGDDVEQMPPGSYFRSMNTVNRGRLVQCRPGYFNPLALPDGVLQGLVMFKPKDSITQLVFAVSGKVYYSAAPFKTYKQIKELQFSPRAAQIYWAITEKAVERNADGSLTLINPYSVLMIQDGLTAPGFWDGALAGHIRGPTKTPLGSYMAWSGDRLWVARGKLLFAGDIADPFSFFEGLYVGTTGAFVLPGLITGLADIPSADASALLCFTEETTTRFQSYSFIRLLWDTTPNFQQVILPETGCASHKSIVAHGGQIWWVAQYGLTNLNAAYATHLDSGIDYVDHQMAISKGYLAPDLSGACSATFEKYLLVSVPYADWFNTHTWCYDSSRHNSGQPSWNSFWVGTRPVEWAVGVIDDQPRIFQASVDYDGHNRIWEAFSEERLDNGCPITCTLETRGYTAGTTGPKEFQWADVWFSELAGDVDVRASWGAATRGRYKSIMSKRIHADQGTIRSATLMRFDRTDFALKKQVRTLQTESRQMTDPDPFSSCGVESDTEEWTSSGFHFCIIWNGPGAIRALRVFLQETPEPPQGACEADEIDVRASRFDGADAAAPTFDEVLLALQKFDPVYTAESTQTATNGNLTAVGTGFAESRISQQTAQKMADCQAEHRAAKKLEAMSPGYLGGFAAGN